MVFVIIIAIIFWGVIISCLIYGLVVIVSCIVCIFKGENLSSGYPDVIKKALRH